MIPYWAYVRQMPCGRLVRSRSKHGLASNRARHFGQCRRCQRWPYVREMYCGEVVRSTSAHNLRRGCNRHVRQCYRCQQAPLIRRLDRLEEDLRAFFKFMRARAGGGLYDI